MFFSEIGTEIIPLDFKVGRYLARKYLFRRYILGVLKHIIALDRHWGGDETLK